MANGGEGSVGEAAIPAPKKRRHDRSFESCREASDATYKLVEIRRAPLNHLSEVILHTYRWRNPEKSFYIQKISFFFSRVRALMARFLIERKLLIIIVIWSVYAIRGLLARWRDKKIHRKR